MPHLSTVTASGHWRSERSPLYWQWAASRLIARGSFNYSELHIFSQQDTLFRHRAHFLSSTCRDDSDDTNLSSSIPAAQIAATVSVADRLLVLAMNVHALLALRRCRLQHRVYPIQSSSGLFGGSLPLTVRHSRLCSPLIHRLLSCIALMAHRNLIIAVRPMVKAKLVRQHTTAHSSNLRTGMEDTERLQAHLLVQTRSFGSGSEPSTQMAQGV